MCRRETAHQTPSTNLMLLAAPADSSFTLRLCAPHAPAGVSLTFDGQTFKYTAEGPMFETVSFESDRPEPPDPESTTVYEPDPDDDLQAWLVRNFYIDGAEETDPRIPTGSPATQFVIKIQPATVGSGWLLLDDDGATVQTESGPLIAPATGTATAAYGAGASWTHVSASIKSAHKGGTILLKVRSTGSNNYALEWTASTLRLLKNSSGSPTVLDSWTAGDILDQFDADEFVKLEIRCWTGRDNKVQVRGFVDGMAVLSGHDDSSTYSSGTVALERTSNVAAQFDDLLVRRLTQLGTDAEVLLSEPFSELPGDWTFGGAWSVSSAGHDRLDISLLEAVLLHLDYRYRLVEPA